MVLNGIDVSQHQGIVDWSAVANGGIDFAILRAGYGGTSDLYFARNAAACQSVGLPIGLFWFSYALNPSEAREEAHRLLYAADGLRIEYPLVFDFEYASVDYAARHGIYINKDAASEIAFAFLTEIENAGYFAMNYTNVDYLNRYFTSDLRNRFGVWLASWSNREEPPTDCYIWQHSNTGKVPGISGNVDLDRAYIDFPSYLREAGLNHLAPPPDPVITWAVNAGITENENWDGILTKKEIVEILKRYDERNK